MTIVASRAEAVGMEAPHGATAELRRLPRLSVILHWVIAALVLLMFCMGVLMKQLGDGPWADILYNVHKMTGVALLGLILMRLGYRAFAQFSGRWRRGVASRPVHGVLYAGLVLVPLLGWAGISDYGARTVFFGWSIPAIWPEGAGHSEWLFRAHGWLAFTLLGLVAVHIGLALSDFIQRGAQRMAVPGQGEKAFPRAADMP